MREDLWTAQQINYLRTHSLADCYAHLGRTHGAINAKRAQLGLGEKQSKPWTTQEEVRLADLTFKGKTIYEIAGIMGRTPLAIQDRLYKRKLPVYRRTPEWAH